jgi:phosphoribosylaminoimidazole carboxylase (NCAIR synthetase)
MKQPAFVMVNLLGQSTRTPLVKKFPTGSVHWYEKTENRARRKMGHINYIGRNKNNLLKRALSERKGILI